jgi:ubiquinone/menaquinone biosynthesis C-methylase UbiE
VVFLNVDASEPSFGPASFDAVLASFVVYLLADPGAALARWRNLLRPGGILAFTFVRTVCYTLARQAPSGPGG